MGCRGQQHPQTPTRPHQQGSWGSAQLHVLNIYPCRDRSSSVLRCIPKEVYWKGDANLNEREMIAESLTDGRLILPSRLVASHPTPRLHHGRATAKPQGISTPLRPFITPSAEPANPRLSAKSACSDSIFLIQQRLTQAVWRAKTYKEPRYLHLSRTKTAPKRPFLHCFDHFYIPLQANATRHPRRGPRSCASSESLQLEAIAVSELAASPHLKMQVPHENDCPTSRF